MGPRALGNYASHANSMLDDVTVVEYNDHESGGSEMERTMYMNIVK